MKLTTKQQEWVDLVVGKGMPAVEEAIEWGHKSMWASQHDSVGEVANCLKLDLTEDYQFNGAKSRLQAYKFLGILEKIGSI